jgi:hypothetical protein
MPSLSAGRVTVLVQFANDNMEAFRGILLRFVDAMDEMVEAMSPELRAILAEAGGHLTEEPGIDSYPTANIPLDICWREDCDFPVEPEDPVGLCASCVKELREL